MRWDDPNRPKLTDSRPMYFHDRPLAALPSITMQVEGEGWDLSIMLKEQSGFGYYHARPESDEALLGLLRDWHLDPEGVMLKWFGYSGPEAEEKELSLEDLL